MKRANPNNFSGDGANGGCFFQIESDGMQEGAAFLEVGWSCVHVYRGLIPITWLAELIAIATAHEGGIAGFLREHDYGDPSYALMCDPKMPEGD
jgi:hypothetical protein